MVSYIGYTVECPRRGYLRPHRAGGGGEGTNCVGYSSGGTEDMLVDKSTHLRLVGARGLQVFMCRKLSGGRSIAEVRSGHLSVSTSCTSPYFRSSDTQKHTMPGA